MVLAMSRPVKHPKTGVYYFRKAVPEDLRTLVGKREEKVSLGTKNPADAKLAHARIAEEVEARWKALRSQPEPLTHKQVVALAGEVYREWLGHFADDPGSSDVWAMLVEVQQNARAAAKLVEWVGPAVDGLLLKRGLRTDDASRVKLVEEVDRAMLQAAEQLRRNASGDYRPDPQADRFPTWEPPKGQKAVNSSGDSLTKLVDDWWREAKAAGLKVSTYESYRSTIAKLVAFLGHDDPSQVTAENVVAFKDFRLASVNPRTGKPISPKSVKDSDISGLKSVFAWAVTNRRMTSNPAQGITIKLGKSVKLRSKGFTDSEAVALLRAAANLTPGREHAKTFAAKRWASWLCAYSGARVGEMLQLRKEDLRREGEWWVLRVTPEAGTVKSNEARDVVLHPHLVELGFPEFVAGCAPGHLFITPDKDGDVRSSWRTMKNRVTEFARTVVTDPNVAPNHGWRHRFKTVGMETGIDLRIIDAIQGHSPRTAGESYGDVTVKVRAMAMERLPRYEIG
ncbi:Site-specific recombinase XerD [uncultured Alphaproteobacteria bacterium]|uniref:Site-specific recombinase XerD n=1 Tax=uncultured Alphaproteobacteria bacterium TaxID=91750 RepID=A0A212KM44_9PROT|nr:Site-specific recombinase XerD [uncultured Alphaproteobacteria bacterium]